MSNIRSPTGALRGDVTDTLHAAIADPDVRSRLGRLAKAEHWSGFGDAEMVFAEAPDKPAPKKADADDKMADRQSDLATARLHVDDCQRAPGRSGACAQRGRRRP